VNAGKFGDKSMEEEWEDVIGYEGDYRISNQGRVMSLKHGNTRIMKLRENRTGYVIIGWYKNKRHKTSMISRLVAQHFLPDWDESLQVDHINGVRAENHIDNLRMVTNAQNLRSFQKVRGKSKFRGVSWNKSVKKWIARIMLDGKRKHLGCFNDEAAAARAWDAAAIESGYNPEALNFK
jgi:hypothetical protein